MRVSLFFDGSNFFHGMEARTQGVELDYEALASWLVARVGGVGASLASATYYTGTADQPGLDRFLSGLELCPGYFVSRQPVARRLVECPSCRAEQEVRSEKRVDTQIVADMIRLAYAGAYDRAVLLSGDDDLVPALEVVQGTGRPVHVATWGGHGLAPTLRAAAWSHLDLLEALADVSTGRARGEELDDQVVLGQLNVAVGYFTDRGGHLSRWYFVNRWSAEGALMPEGPPRARAVDRLVAAGAAELYEADVNGRQVVALRPRPAAPDRD